MQSLKKILGINLRYYRYLEKLSQEKFYAKYNLSIKYMSCIERGEVNVTLDFVDKISKKLNIPSQDLITFNEEKMINKKRVDAR